MGVTPCVIACAPLHLASLGLAKMDNTLHRDSDWYLYDRTGAGHGHIAALWAAHVRSLTIPHAITCSVLLELGAEDVTRTLFLFNVHF